MTRRICVTLSGLFCACAVFFSCKQSDIFHLIQLEVAPKKPKIEGSPSKIVKGAGDDLYVANGGLWKWDGSAWSKDGGPAGDVRDVAYAGSDLYALTLKDTGAKLWRRASGGNGWNSITAPDRLQAVFGADDKFFAYAITGDAKTEAYAVYKLNAAKDELKEISTPAQKIYGAIKLSSNYYIAAQDGIYKSTDGGNTFKKEIDSTDGKGAWVGIAKKENYSEAIAVSKNGWVSVYSSSSQNFIVPTTRLETSYSFTGAICYYKRDSTECILLGISSTSYTNGYREFEPQTRTDGGGQYGKPSHSVRIADRYDSTIGTNVVNSIAQSNEIQNGYPVLFASTQQKGVWSYRGDNWNAED